jgi:hypothetical protein
MNRYGPLQIIKEKRKAAPAREKVPDAPQTRPVDISQTQASQVQDRDKDTTIHVVRVSLLVS